MSYHTIILVGNLGRDPEMRYTPNGQPVTNFSVAVDDSYTSNTGERIARTIWFRVSSWGRQAESCNQYLKKGRKVLVEGRLTIDPATGGPRTYTRQDGTTTASLEVSASQVRFLSSRGEADAETPIGSSFEEEPDQDNIPF